MANDYYNSEGYYDPTAGEALRNATSFRIVHPTGYVQKTVPNGAAVLLPKAAG